MTHVKKVVENLVRQYNTRSPFVIGEQKEYEIFYSDFKDVGGMYCKVLDNKFIYINENLDALSKQIVCAYLLWYGERYDSRNFLKLMLSKIHVPTFTQAEKEARFFALELVLFKEHSRNVFFYPAI